MNHLGLVVEYHDLRKKLPAIQQDLEVRGVFTWFEPGRTVPNPKEYLKWACDAIESGKRFVIFGNTGLFGSEKGTVTLSEGNRLFRKLGLKQTIERVNLVYDLKVKTIDPSLMKFERSFGELKPPFDRTVKIDSRVRSHLVLVKKNNPTKTSHLVVTGPNGGYVAAGYALFSRYEHETETRGWYLNPFRFFQIAFQTNDLPKPDTTTLAGRRIYYSHIDGDGWNNLSLMEEYRKRPTLSSKVVLEKAILPYPDLPVTVAPVAAELDPNWSGEKKSGTVAKELFKLPQVEIGSHSYSHPFQWDFFEDRDTEKERPYLHLYPNGSWGSKVSVSAFLALFNKKENKMGTSDVQGYSKYRIPRGYATKPFDIDLEVQGSIDLIEQFAPNGKKSKVMMWSGNTTPFEEALRKTRLAGLANINGGDSRFDSEYPSYAWVAPIGRASGKERQIYATNSNENTYTNLWKGKYHGFQYLPQTLENTESPIRIKPFNIYYHMYSGERAAAVNALLKNLNYARSKELTPITASHFANIGQGFYTTRLLQLDENQWRVEERGALQTIRFDRQINQSVDFHRSTGVIGQRIYQNNLYVYLDSAVTSPVITLKRNSSGMASKQQTLVSLIHSRFPVQNLIREKNEFHFETKGFGQLHMIWKVPNAGMYELKINKDKKRILQKEVTVQEDQILEIREDISGFTPLKISVTHITSS